jgi:hypothetical protein
MQRTIIAICGPSNVGKTTTICLAYQRLLEEGKQINPGRRTRKEVGGAILEIDGVTVGFASQGDVERMLQANLEPLLAAECDVIVCACHTSRSRTHMVVERLTGDFRVVWIEKRRAALVNAERANQECAEEIIKQVRAAIELAQLVES